MHAAEDLGYAKVGDFEMSLIGQEEILELDVTMGNAMIVQVSHATEELFPQAQVIVKCEVAFLHQREQLALLAVLHDDVPTAGVGTEANALHNVGMPQALGNGVFRLDLLVVLVGILILASFPKLLDGVDLVPVPASSHQLDRRRGSFAHKLAPSSR